MLRVIAVLIFLLAVIDARAMQSRSDRERFAVILKPYQKRGSVRTGEPLLIDPGIVCSHVRINERTLWIELSLPLRPS